MSSSAQNDLSYFREQFHLIVEEEDIEALLEAPIQENDSTKRSIVIAYKGLCNAMMAEHVFSPLSKLKYFNRGKDMIEQAIAKVKNTETVYIRLLLQLSVPRFLNYYENIEEDLSFFKSNVAQSSVPVPYRHTFVAALCKIENDNYELNSLKKLKLE